MFCTSLRRRRGWGSIPSILLSSQNPKWDEKSLETYDLAVPLPSTNGQPQKDYFRFLLLSTIDLQQLTDTLARIERLYHQRGGRHVGIVFFLNEEGNAQNGTLQMMNLQAHLLPALDMPILLLYSLTCLQATLCTFQKKIVTTRAASSNVPKAMPAMHLLPYCTIKPPLPQHTRNVLSDTFHSISELAQAATTHDGQEGLKQLISEPKMGTAEEVSDFWVLEYTVD